MRMTVILIPTLLGLLFSACSNAQESVVQRVFGRSVQAPVFIDCKALSSEKILFQFSVPVAVKALHFSPHVDVAGIDDGADVHVHLGQTLGAGERITADILVEDAHRNSLNVLVSFRSRNDRMPRLIITELRTEYSKPRVEFVEFRTLSAGNLGALRLFIAGNGIDSPVFDFPPVEVAAGEYIVVHLRSIEEGIVDETGQNLGASGGTDADPFARDFWVPDAKKVLRKTDAVFFTDQDDNILDAVVLSENPDSWGTRQSIPLAVEMLYRKGAWSSASPEDAVASKGTTATRTISRDESLANSRSARDWYITATGGSSAGRANNPKRYEPK